MKWTNTVVCLAEEGQANLLVWCGWPQSAQYYPSKNKDRPWFKEPALINPIFHVTHWMTINPPTINLTGDEK